MVEYQRLVDYINNYFPDPVKYTQSDIRKWAKKSVPAWKNMSKKTQDGIIKDWDHFQKPTIKVDRPRDSRGRFTKWIRGGKTPTRKQTGRPRDSRGRFTRTSDKIKKFLGRSY